MMAKRKKKVIPKPELPPEADIAPVDYGPDYEDGPEFDGYEERAAETEQPAFAEDEVASVASTDDDGYLIPPESEDEGLVVVQDFDPADPGAPIAEPQKVLRPHDRIQRKRDRGHRE